MVSVSCWLLCDCSAIRCGTRHMHCPANFNIETYIRHVADNIAEMPVETLPDSPLLYEDQSGREENIKRFVREDRAVEAGVYPYPVHYQENGE